MHQNKPALHRYLQYICIIISIAILPSIMNANPSNLTSPSDSLDILLDQRMQGAWQMIIDSVDPFESSTGDQIKLFSEGYFMLAIFDSRKREYYVTAGGTYAIRNGVMSEYLIFHSYDPDLIGKTFSYKLTVSRDRYRQEGYVELHDIKIDLDEEYERLDYGVETPIAGAWRLESPYNPSTTVLRLISGTIFQEVEYDNRTRRVLSAMGGRYSLRNNQWRATIHYHMKNSQAVYEELIYTANYQRGNLFLSHNSAQGVIREEWRRLD